ncbi:hypothetical protein GCM10010954_21220 [Halobacillus andaensis]|uniref:Secreted protein n=1 Tax=Halobacillus andaensis TaxID=1176239 RepID=A0A917EWJ5_HALAA|nr:hypothetical protein [Halobacillus andaensis]MBP2004371.1 hypothetical protein [Halobacillus andaensis]GGF22121.1 hypothetical protein GCM10010954_21220 [Halobacillus andaensis]
MIKKLLKESRSFLLLGLVIIAMATFKQVDTINDEDKTFIENYNTEQTNNQDDTQISN